MRMMEIMGPITYNYEDKSCIFEVIESGVEQASNISC